MRPLNHWVKSWMTWPMLAREVMTAPAALGQTQGGGPDVELDVLGPSPQVVGERRGESGNCGGVHDLPECRCDARVSGVDLPDHVGDRLREVVGEDVVVGPGHLTPRTAAWWVQVTTPSSTGVR